MMSFIRNAVAALSVLMLTAGSASATIVFPGFNPDDGTEIFMPDNIILSVEFFDLLDVLPPPGGLEFGFYFAADDPLIAANRTTIFDSFDPFGASVALVNFGTGVVRDIDAGGTVQDLFTAGVAPIGFYIESGPNILFTQSGLNPGNLDSAETLPSIADPSNYLIGFELPDGAGGEFTVALELVTGLSPTPTPPQAISEPASATLLLMGLLLTGVGVVRRKRRLS